VSFWPATALIVHSTRIAQTLYGFVQELGGFERNDWLAWPLRA
jgi:hypothetical protein